MRAGVPLVQLDCAVRGVRADAVMVDNGAASARAVDHLLLELGHRRIGLEQHELNQART